MQAGGQLIIMNLFFLCKRRYMNHDVIHDRYGRLYHLPDELAKRGHKVTAVCLDYQGTESVTFTGEKKQVRTYPDNIRWYSFCAGPVGVKLPAYLCQLIKKVRQDKPDLLIGGSDVLHVILTAITGRLTAPPSVIDLYDNFESFGMSRIPFMKPGYRKALCSVQGVTTVSNALNQHISALAPCPVITVESTIPGEMFRPLDKKQARARLGLPEQGKLIGTAGSLAANRGTAHLYAAARSLIRQNPDMYLVLAGPVHDAPPPRHDNILYLGALDHALVPSFFNALDVAVLCMADNEFGRYAFPQKLYEILACQVPVVAAAVGAIKELLSPWPQTLYPPDNETELKQVMLKQMQSPCIPELSIPLWPDQAEKLECFYLQTLPWRSN